MLTFNGHQIFGTHDAVIAQPPQLLVSRTRYWGLVGDSEIVGERGGREVSCYIWLHDRYASRNDVEMAVVDINGWVGEHGDLIEYDQFSGTQLIYQNMTFHGFEKMPFGGREDAGPIMDYAGTIDSGWVQAGTLRFYQLSPS